MRFFGISCLAASVCAFNPTNNKNRIATSSLNVVSRKEVLTTIASSVVYLTISKANAEEIVTLPKENSEETVPLTKVEETPSKTIETVTLANGVSYDIEKKGKGPKPERGELAAIRFSAFAGKNKIDDIFETQEPYYTRIGSGAMLKGVEDTLPLMRVGDRWKLTIPGKLAFGPKGRPASAGKPRIPGDATIIFDVEMVGLPGKEEELIELIGD